MDTADFSFDHNPNKVMTRTRIFEHQFLNNIKYMTVLVGIGIIAGIQVFHSHEHSEHEHGHEHFPSDVPYDDHVENISVKIDST